MTSLYDSEADRLAIEKALAGIAWGGIDTKPSDASREQHETNFTVQSPAAIDSSGRRVSRAHVRHGSDLLPSAQRLKQIIQLSIEKEAEKKQDAAIETTNVPRTASLHRLDSVIATTIAANKWKKKKQRVVNKLHHFFELTCGIVMGIRHTVRMYHDTKEELTESDFHSEHKVVFPAKGSAITPPHSLAKGKSFEFKDYAGKVFAYLRHLDGIAADDYLQSVASNLPYLDFITNSKSHQFFFFSFDRKFLIKTQPKSESKFLRSFLKYYYQHVTQNPGSLIVRLYGIHRITMGDKEVHFIIMRNVFPADKPIHQKFDLKGSTLGRAASERERRQLCPVLKDLDFLDTYIEVGPEGRKAFQKQLEVDVKFLMDQKIMDYSLLLGVHFPQREPIEEEEMEELDLNGLPQDPAAGSALPAAPHTRGSSEHSLSRSRRSIDSTGEVEAAAPTTTTTTATTRTSTATDTVTVTTTTMSTRDSEETPPLLAQTDKARPALILTDMPVQDAIDVSATEASSESDRTANTTFPAVTEPERMAKTTFPGVGIPSGTDTLPVPQSSDGTATTDGNMTPSLQPPPSPNSRPLTSPKMAPRPIVYSHKDKYIPAKPSEMIKKRELLDFAQEIEFETRRTSSSVTHPSPKNDEGVAANTTAPPSLANSLPSAGSDVAVAPSRPEDPTLVTMEMIGVSMPPELEEKVQEVAVPQKAGIEPDLKVDTTVGEAVPPLVGSHHSTPGPSAMQPLHSHSHSHSHRPSHLRFQQDGLVVLPDGGILSSPTTLEPAVYYMGLIDILQVYNMRKRSEHLIKSLRYDPKAISAVSPENYGNRFLKFILDHVR